MWLNGAATCYFDSNTQLIPEISKDFEFPYGLYLRKVSNFSKFNSKEFTLTLKGDIYLPQFINSSSDRGSFDIKLKEQESKPYEVYVDYPTPSLSGDGKFITLKESPYYTSGLKIDSDNFESKAKPKNSISISKIAESMTRIAEFEDTEDLLFDLTTKHENLSLVIDSKQIR